jgi:aminoglycoside phosphotransferase (APT) family kinase protein
MPLGPYIREVAGADAVTVEDGAILTGGAIQENRALTLVVRGGPMEGRHEVVLRAEAMATIPESRPLGQQFALLCAAHAAGVTVPEPLWYCDDPRIAGKPFYIMRRIPGEALGIRVTRMGPMPEVAAALGGELARIHSIAPPRSDLSFLGAVTETPARDAIARYRAYLDAEPEPHPALEWTLRWLELNAPPSDELVLCHRDFRTGNYMIHEGRLTGVLDWEFAGWGDPHEDVAWFCARCWRFSGPKLEAGGIATRDAFYSAYEAASGRKLDRSRIAYWETMAHVRWAVIALQQTMRHRSGSEPSLELALIGRRLAELEYECLRLTGVL